MKQPTPPSDRTLPHTTKQNQDIFAILQGREASKLSDSPNLQVLHRNKIDLARRLRRAKRRLLLNYVEQSDSSYHAESSRSLSSLSEDDEGHTDLNTIDEDLDVDGTS